MSLLPRGVKELLKDKLCVVAEATDTASTTRGFSLQTELMPRTCREFLTHTRTHLLTYAQNMNGKTRTCMQHTHACADTFAGVK